MKRNEGLSEVIRYEEDLRNKIQQTDNLILQGRLDPPQIQALNDLVREEDVIIRYLQVQSSKLQPEVRNLYGKNMLRFKKKIKEHKEYINAQFGSGTAKRYHDPYNVAQTIKIQQENIALANQKRVMYQNDRIQDNIGFDLQRQGQTLQTNIDRNRGIRQQADQASDSIKLIQKSILKRKIMFYSIFVFLGLAIVFIIFRKLSKSHK